MRKVIAYIFFIVTISCANTEKIFQKVKLDDSDYALYFMAPLGEMDLYDTNQVKSFKIDNDSIIKEILNSWKAPILQDTIARTYYYFEISKSNETYVGRWFDSELDYIIGEHVHRFNKQDLMRYIDYFETIEAYIIEFDDIESAREFVGVIKGNNGYIPFHRKDLPLIWEKYRGKIVLEYINDKIPQFQYTDEINTYLNKLFKDICKVEVLSWHFQATQDRAEMEILTEIDISNNLPEGFIIKDKWREIDDLYLRVYNLNEYAIKKLSDKYKIQIDSITQIYN